NRRFLIAATANGLVDDLPLHLMDYPPAGTILDMLSRRGISWMNYHAVAGDVSKLRRLARHRRRVARRRLLSLLEGVRHALDVPKDIQFTADLFPLGIARHVLHVEPIDDFFDAAENGRLPAFSIVDPSFEHFSEENPQDIGMG